MNEELKIIIRAETAQAEKNMKAVKQELKDIKTTGDESGKSVGESMRAVGRGAAIAMAAIAALTAAMVSLGKAAQDVNKGLEKLNTTFLNNGSTVKQASKTYKDLFGALGDHDKAIETAQSLALITTEEKKLDSWTNVLIGAFAEMGDKLPTEGLAEAANATIKLGEVDGVMADALEWKGVSLEGFNQALAQTTSLEEREALVLNTLNGLYGNSAKLYQINNQATINYNKSQANLNLALAQATSYTTPFLTSINNLGSTLLTVLAPALGTVATYMTAFIQLMAEAIQWVGSFFGMFGSNTESTTANVAGYKEAMKKYLESLRSGFGGANNNLEETLKGINAVKKATMGFDELNIVSKPTSGASVPSVGGGGVSTPTIPVAPNPEDFGIGAGSSFEQISKDIGEAKEKIKSILPLIGIGAAAWGGWNLIKFIKELGGGSEAVKELQDAVKMLGFKWDGFDKQVANATWKEGFKKLGGVLKGLLANFLIIGGAIAAVVGFSDAWVNGLDWGNFAAILGGLAAVVGGIALKFGGIATPIALIVAGVLALVIGIKDLVTNGYSMEAVILVAVGAIAVLIGVVWALNAALLANPITWIVVAIMALVAVFVILWNECEGFRNFWINLWDNTKSVFAAVWDWLKKFFTETIPSIFNTVLDFVKENWQGLLLLLVNPFAGAFKLLYDNCEGFRNFIDKWVAKIKQFFKDLWQGIKNIFASVGKWFSDVFTGAWEGIKKAFSAVGNFFTGIWNTIKEIFSKVGSVIGNAVSNAFSSAINWVLEKAIGIINGFIKAINLAIGIINKIPGVDIKKLALLDVPKLARGGITTGPTTALIGEAGKEAVLPLENNTGWMDTLADRIASRNNTPSRIVLTLDGKELGWANIRSINDITKQTGVLPLVLA